MAAQAEAMGDRRASARARATMASALNALAELPLDAPVGPPPPAWLLAIRGERFELGESLSDVARHSLQTALQRAADWMDGE